MGTLSEQAVFIGKKKIQLNKKAMNCQLKSNR